MTYIIFNGGSWLVLNVPVLINDGVWVTKTLTSGRQDAYIQPDAGRQIFSSTCAAAQGADPRLTEFPGMFFTVNNVKVFVPFIRVDNEKVLVALLSSCVLTRIRV
jgi:hypothetical protein